MASVSPADLAYRPIGQVVQEAAIENGLRFGEDMYEPEGQHPKRPVEPVNEENASDHFPPHTVCVKPLDANT